MNITIKEVLRNVLNRMIEQDLDLYTSDIMRATLYPQKII